METLFRVTASALRFRAAPATTAAVLAVIPGGGVVTADGAARADGWMGVTWQGVRGFVKRDFLADAASAAPATAEADPARRNADPACLHPVFRERALDALKRLRAEAIPFAIYEGFRGPRRQAALYAKGRDAPGDIVTKARPWESFHQYGLAADFVLLTDKGWSWDDKGANASFWTRLAEIARSNGLKPLDFERPHLQLDGVVLADLRAGIYPAGGDGTWIVALEDAIELWSGTPAAPPRLMDRPPLVT